MSRAIFVLLAAALGLHAATGSQKVFPLAYDQHDYPNGLRLITIHTDYPNIVAVYIVVQTGSRNEVEPGKSGFAHLFEHMMFRGTKTYPPEKYEAILKNAGATSNAYTSDDLTVYHTTFSKEDLETILKMEADRFQNLEYTEEVFRTEALAVLGEYNKNAAQPTEKLEEVLRDTAYRRHTYKHTTMGFLKDIQDMPNQFEYSKLFFDRYYRPEYTTIIVAGDVTPERSRAFVAKYWGRWKRGSFKPNIPAEPAPEAPKKAHVDWPSPTLPWINIAHHGAAYSDTGKDMAVLDIISFVGFSESSELYQKLVIQEQNVDILYVSNPDHIDPYLFTVEARVRNEADMDYVRDAIMSTLDGFKETLVPAKRLDDVKNHLRYELALRLNNTEAIAGIVARYVALRRTPETINKVYEIYSQVTPEDVRNIARKYFTEDRRVVVTLTGSKSK